MVVWYPAISALIDWRVLGEKPGALQVIGLAMALLSVAGMFLPMATTSVSWELVLGSMLAVVGALTAALYFSIGRWLRKQGVPLLGYATSVYTIAAVTLLTMSLVLGEELIVSSYESWFFLFLLAVLPMIGGHTVINYLLRRLRTFVATSVAIGEPAGATILAIVILGQEQPGHVLLLMPLTLLGLLLVLYRYGG